MLAKKKPRDAAGLFRKLSTSASPSWRRRDTTWQHLAMSGRLELDFQRQ
jgi:hypothetical protein